MLEPGTVLDGRYSIRGSLGTGGMGEVYRAERLLLGDEVAIKIVRATADDPAILRERFLRESRAVARLRHPHIVTILDFAIGDDAQPYLVMEYLNGPNLAQALTARGRFDLSSVRSILPGLCSALQLAHESGFVHRDLKPTNIVSQRYETGEVVWKIIDFGVVNIIAPDAPRLTAAEQFVGTVSYAAPEQLCAQAIDGRTDLYALGVITFELLTGSLPFKGDSLLALIQQHLNVAPPDLAGLRPDLPDDVAFAVMRCLAKAPADRWSTATSFCRALCSEEAPTVMVEGLAPAGLLGTYEIGPVIAHGRFGSEIHQGTHRALNHPVAIRTFRPSPGVDRDAVRTRFLSEARALQVSHPNIVNVRDFGESGDTLYLVTDLLEGCSLAELLSAEGPFGAGRLHAFVGQLADATSAIHLRGGLISGLHPGIIRVVREHGQERVAISSAGVCSLHDVLATLDEAVLRGRAITGTELPYAAPELLTGRPATPATDVFTIGVLAYQMASGRLPFDAPSLPELVGVMLSTTPPRLDDLRKDVPPAKLSVIHGCLAVDPSARFASARDLLAAWMAAGR